MARHQKWDIGSYFAVELEDGSCSIGQKIGREPQALNSAICAFSKLRYDKTPTRMTPLQDSELVSVQFVTRDSLDRRMWKIFDHGPPMDVNKFFDLSERRKLGFVGTKIVGSGIIIRLMDAYFGLYPWNANHDPKYFDGLLLSPDRKPEHVVLK